MKNGLKFLSVAFALWLCSSNYGFAQLNKMLNDAKNLKKDVQKTSGDVKKTSNSGNSNSTQSLQSNQQPDNSAVSGRDWYVSISTGTGKEGTKEKPAKEIAAIALQLQPGDVIHIAEGIYKGKADMSSDILTVPVSIIGGYSTDFSVRDPWGAHKTVLSGVNGYMKSETTSRLSIQCSKTHKDYSGQVLIDGIIIDNGDRNFYIAKTKDKYIKRKASPGEGFNPTPDTPGIEIDMATGANVVLRNCILTNIAASQGVIDVQVGKDSKVLIENNLLINNTGDGISAKTSWQSDEGHPQYTIKNNTILFSSKYDEFATNHGGNSIKTDERVKLSLENNVFAFNDYGGIDNIKKCKNVSMRNNLFTGNRKYDYREYNTPMAVTDLADYADYAQAEGNTSVEIKVPVSKEWATTYMGRVIPDRDAVSGSVNVPNSDANALRSMLGLPVQGTSVGAQSEVWLNRIQLADAISAGLQQYNGKGCIKP